MFQSPYEDECLSDHNINLLETEGHTSPSGRYGRRPVKDT
jgi:hypothetical protein